VAPTLKSGGKKAPGAAAALDEQAVAKRSPFLAGKVQGRRFSFSVVTGALLIPA